MSTTAATLVSDARRHVTALDPHEFAAAADEGAAIVIDLRESDERVRDGSIHGSVHVPRGMLEFRADPASAYHDERLRPDARVLLYCASGGRSALAAATLQAMGYRDVAHLEGGVNAWAKSGLPLFGPQRPPY